MSDSLQTLSILIGARLVACGWKLATAESCTGGLLSAAITEIAGSSTWFERGFVTYSNASKTELLNVPEDILANDGAVSEETARAMAEGALMESYAQLAVSITGIAGPGGGSSSKPVGTVCFGWALVDTHKELEVQTQIMHFSGDRASIRQQAVLHALGGVLLRLDRNDCSDHPEHSIF